MQVVPPPITKAAASSSGTPWAKATATAPTAATRVPKTMMITVAMPPMISEVRPP